MTRVADEIDACCEEPDDRQPREDHPPNSVTPPEHDAPPIGPSLLFVPLSIGEKHSPQAPERKSDQSDYATNPVWTRLPIWKADAMRYFFDIFDGDHWARDDFGVDCARDRSARHQAVLALTELARELLPSSGSTQELVIRVRLKEELAFSVRLAFDTSFGPALTDPAMVDNYPLPT